MIYVNDEYVHTNGDLKCPVCTAHILPTVMLLGKNTRTKIECYHCLNEFKITVKIKVWEDHES